MSAGAPEILEATKGQSTRESIMSAVVRVVADRGLRGLTFRSIAAEIDVSPTLIVHHFGTRDALIAETLAWVTQQAIEKTKLSIFASSEIEFEEALIDSVLKEPEIHAFQIEIMLEARRRPELQADLRQIYATYFAAVEERFLVETETKITAKVSRTIFACFDGLILEYFGGAITIDEFREAVEFIWRLSVSTEN